MHTIRVYDMDRPNGKRLVWDAQVKRGFDEKDLQRSYPEGNRFLWLR